MALKFIASNNAIKLCLILILRLFSVEYLHAQKPELVVPLGHTSIINKIVSSADHKYILSASRDKSIKLWSVADKKEIKTFEGHDDGVNDIAMSANGKFFFSASSDDKILLWDISSGKNIKTYTHHSGAVNFIYVSKNNKTFISSSEDHSIQIVDVNTANVLRNYNEQHSVLLITEISEGVFAHLNNHGELFFHHADDNNKDTKILLNDNLKCASTNGNQIVYIDERNQINWLSLALLKVVKTAQIAQDLKINFIQINENNKAVIASSNGDLFSFDEKPDKLGTINTTIKTGCVLSDNIFAVAGNNRIIYRVNADEKVKKHVAAFLSGHAFFFNQAAFAPQNGIIAIAGKDNSVRTFNINNNYNKRIAVAKDEMLCVSISQNENTLIAGSKDKNIYIWNFKNASIQNILSGHDNYVTDVSFVNDSECVSASKDGRLLSWNIPNGIIKNTFSGHHGAINTCAVSDDGKYVASGGVDSTVKLWDVTSGKLLETFPSQRMNGSQRIRYYGNAFYSSGMMPSIVKVDLQNLTSKIYDAGFNVWDVYANENKFITNDNAGEVTEWNIESKEKTKSFNGHKRQVNGIFKMKNFLITSGFDQSIRVWNYEMSKELATIYFIDTNDWVVLSPTGRFDATAGAMKLMYYTVGLECVELGQLKDRYYEPGLLQKVMGVSAEAMRSVNDLKELSMYPKIELNVNNDATSQANNLNIKLRNQGGGIGKTLVYINGKEIASDARGGNVKPDADSANLTINILNHPYLQNGENTIEVKSYNAEGYLISRGVSVTVNHHSDEKKNAPSLYLLCVGTSDYAGTSIDLKYAAKDATDFYKAALISGEKLFNAERVHSYLVTTDTVANVQPTRDNLKKLLSEIATQSKSEDVLVVYLSGHGINTGGPDGDFYYLTKEAHASNAEAYEDPVMRASVSISAAELTDYLKKIPALKQVLIIDACASGRVVENMMAKRDISSSTVRALERMKDRTGMHIITGCAADAVSYEASRFGQGLLTYSLLEGIKGLSLRENHFVDVNMLFQHARERVPLLASGIGGIQEPKVFSPYGEESFDIGELNDEDKKSIPLAQAKPMFIRSTFIDIDQSEDILNLGTIMDNSMMEVSVRGINSSIIFVDVKEFPDAYKLSGSYKQQDGKVLLKLKIKSQSMEKRIDIKANSVSDLKIQILEEIQKIMRN